jgi:hypothetical protein
MSVIVRYCYRASSQVAQKVSVLSAVSGLLKFSYVGFPWDMKHYFAGSSIEK